MNVKNDIRKKDFVERYAKVAKTTKKAAEQNYEAFIKTLSLLLYENETIYIANLGKFKIARIPPYQKRLPTDEVIITKLKYDVVFEPSPILTNNVLEAWEPVFRSIEAM